MCTCRYVLAVCFVCFLFGDRLKEKLLLLLLNQSACFEPVKLWGEFVSTSVPQLTHSFSESEFYCTEQGSPILLLEGHYSTPGLTDSNMSHFWIWMEVYLVQLNNLEQGSNTDQDWNPWPPLRVLDPILHLFWITCKLFLHNKQQHQVKPIPMPFTSRFENMVLQQPSLH